MCKWGLTEGQAEVRLCQKSSRSPTGTLSHVPHTQTYCVRKDVGITANWCRTSQVSGLGDWIDSNALDLQLSRIKIAESPRELNFGLNLKCLRYPSGNVKWPPGTASL